MKDKMINGEQLIKLMISFYNKSEYMGFRNEKSFRDGMSFLLGYTQTFIRDMSGGFKGDSSEDWLGITEEDYLKILQNIPQWSRDVEDLKY